MGPVLLPLLPFQCPAAGGVVRYLYSGTLRLPQLESNALNTQRPPLY